MKKNRSIIIIASLLVIGAIGLLTQNHFSTLEKNETNFSVRDTASVTKIFIADKNINSVILERGEEGWIINQKYTANTKVVSTLLATMRRMKVKSPVSLASHDNVVKRMATISKKVEIYQEVYRIDMFGFKLFKHEKLTKVFYVGDATRDNLGTYMLMENAKQVYIVYLPGFRGFVSLRFSPLIEDWLSHVVFSTPLSEIKSLNIYFGENDSSGFKVDVKDAMGNYDVTRHLDGNILESYDTLKILNLMTAFSDLRYETRLNNILLPYRIDSIVNSPSMYEITLVDNSSDTTFVKFFKKNRVPTEITKLYDILVPVDHDRLYGLIHGGEDLVLMQYYVFDKVFYPLDYYMK